MSTPWCASVRECRPRTGVTQALSVWLLFAVRVVQEEPKIGKPMVGVVVSKVDIPAGTDLDQLIKDDQFRFILVPQGVAVEGAVTSIDQMTGKSTRVAILAGEKIPMARISGP